MSNSSKVGHVSGGILGLLVVICIVVAANVILGNLHIRKDMTEDQLYVLSDGTRMVLKQLAKPVTLKFFFNGGEGEVPVYFKMFAQRVEDLLAEYQMAAGGRVVVQKFDPKPDSDVEDTAQKLGVAGQPIGMMGPSLYLGLVASTGEADEVLPFIDPQSEVLLEYTITRMIARVATAKKPVVGVLSSLPVLGERRQAYQMPGMPEPQAAWYSFRELRKDYDVREIPPSTDRIDPDVDTLVVVHPKDISAEAQYAIDQFVLRGGRLVAFLDPMSLVDSENQQMPQMRFAPKSSNLDRLLAAWGVKFDTTKVVADLEAMTTVNMGANRVEESPVWLSLRKKHLSNDLLTTRLDSMMMPMAGAFTAEDSKDVKVSPLITSSDASALVDGMTAQFGGEALRKEFKSGLKRLDLAIRLAGKFKTAFPDGRPKPEEAGKDKKPAPPMASGPGLKESQAPTTVILVADADMLNDRFCVQTLGGFGLVAPRNNNIAFFENIIEQLAGGVALTSIRARGKTHRPFEAVLKLQRQAQEQYMEKESALQDKLNKAQERLRELERKKDEKQKLFLSPQQQQEIEQFRGEVAKNREELRVVRKELRGGIENLGMYVKLINIVAMPLVVILAGFIFWGYRRSRVQA